MEKKIIFFCPKCGQLELHQDGYRSNELKCKNCNNNLISTKKGANLGITKEEYQQMLLSGTWYKYLYKHHYKQAKVIYSPHLNEIVKIPEENNIPNNMPQPKCPTCGSTNIRRISTAEKAVNAGMFGLLGNKRTYQFECMNPNCKYKW